MSLAERRRKKEDVETLSLGCEEALEFSLLEFCVSR